MFRRTVSAIMLMLILASILPLAFHIQPVETELSPLTVPDKSAATQGTIDLASQEPPPTEWNKTYGGTGSDTAYSMVQTADGGYALAGSTSSIGAGHADFWFVKIDSAGNMQWNKTYGGTNSECASSVVRTVDGGYALAGFTTSFGAGSWDYWLVKTDAGGNMLWNKTYGGAGYEEEWSMVQTIDGGYALAGWTNSSGTHRALLVKTDASGNMQWNKTYGGSGEAYALVKTVDGGYALAGSILCPDSQDFWLIKTDALGNMQWNKTYGGTGHALASALVQTVDGGYALAGDSPGLGDDDFWLVKTDASGNEVWNMTYGGTGEDVAFSVVQTRDGGYALAGDTYSFDAGGYNAWLVKTDASGNMLWNKTYGGTGTDEAWCVVQTGDGGYAVAGYTNSIGAGHADAWLVKIAASSTADSFRFPLDGFWTVRQRFGGYNYDWNGYHLGEDVLRSFEAPVFAPADGVVKHSAKRTGYGYVVIIEHQLMDGTFVCSVLGHLREADRVPVGAKVTKGQIVGYLSSVPEENGGIIHLHFGIRKGMYSEELDSDGKWRYRGYGPIDIVGSWCPPSAFIDYYNLHKETPPSYNLTINTEEEGGAAALSVSIYTLTFKTVLYIAASQPWFQRWIGTDNDNSNPTTITMLFHKAITALVRSEPPPPPPTPWELAIELAMQSADYALGGGCGWNWTMIWEGDPPELVLHGWGTPKDHPLIVKKWLEANEIKEGYYLYKDTTRTVEFGKGVDCSGLVFWAYNKAWGARPEAMLTTIEPESKRENINPIKYFGAWGQYWGNCHIPGKPDITKDQLQAGDLLFFDTDDPKHLDPDHVAMYVGGPFQYSYGDGKTFTYNVVESTGWGDKIVTVAFYDSTTEDLTTLQPSTGDLRDPPLHVKYYGRPHHQMDNSPLSFTTGSPVDLMVTDPDGIVLTKEVGEIAGMSYTEFDLDGDGELDDKVEVWELKAGNYLVTVIPEPGAPPTGNFTLEASINGTTILLADHAQISEIPTDPYIITQNETAIMLSNINIALTNMTLSKNVVGQGYSLSINATVQNQGNLEETSNITLHANAIPIASQTVTLASGNSTTITFTWNTTSTPKGNYTISAYAWPRQSETYTADNNFTDGQIAVTLLGDVDGNFAVNMGDISAVLDAFGSKLGADGNYWHNPPRMPPLDPHSPNMDIDDNGVVNMGDITTALDHFGQHYP